jgi:hypothetical protein
MGSFSEPWLLSLFERLTFVFCPGAVLFFFTMDMSDVANYLIWLVVVLINGGVYYCLGLVLAVLMKRHKQTRLA